MLRCPACDATYEDRWRCTCTHPLDFADPPRPDPYAPDARTGLWAFAPFFPVESRVTLGEGYTPLTDAPDRDAQFKLEYVLPTGSFKDRGATLTLSRALDAGAERVVEDSSGNAGAAVATYAARAGVDCEIYVPASAKASKLRAIERAGADVVRVEGSRQAVTDACVEAVEAGAGWYASHAWNPAFFAGTATFAYELAHQRDWDVPDAVVLPVGHGTLFLGAYRGFRALREAGWTDSVPRLLGVQAAGYDPIARRFESKRRGSGEGDADPGAERASDATEGANDVADGIQILDPARGDQIRAAVAATDGDCLSVDAAATERELDALHERGFYVEATSAVAPAGLREYRRRGVLDEEHDVVVPLTGSGLKG